MTRAAQSIRFLATTGWQNTDRQRIAGDASNRKYDRLTKADGSTAILMDAPPETGEDVRPFVRIADFLRRSGLSAPNIFEQDEGAGFLLIEDFGDALFADLIAADPGQELTLYRMAADVLIHLRDINPPNLPVCDAAWLTDMIAPLFDWYAPGVSPKDRLAFVTEFRRFAQTAASGDRVLILRDYHAQNLLLLPNRTSVRRVGLLDFQDAMIGHPAYDLVSILQDARRDVRPETEEEVMRYALNQPNTDTDSFRTIYAILGLQRNLRILGIFARLCLRDGKPHYVDLIPRVWGYVLRNLAHPELHALSETLLSTLPAPTPSYLENLKRQCPPKITPS